MVLSTINHAQSNVDNSIGIELQTNGWITYGSHKHFRLCMVWGLLKLFPVNTWLSILLLELQMVGHEIVHLFSTV